MLRVQSSSNWRTWLAASILIAPLVFAGLAFRQGAQARRLAQTIVRTESSLRFTSVTLDTSPPSGVEPVGSPAAFVDFADYQDRIWLSGPAGLYGWDRDGTLAAKYRPGMELPPVELAGVSQGLDEGPKLFIATRGEGLLEFDGRSIREIRPADPAARMLTCVLALPTGRVIFGTEKRGALAFDGHTIAAISASLAAEHVTALAGTEGDLWIGTLANGVWHSHAGQLDHFNAPDALPDRQVLSLASQGDAAWIGTPLGVVEYRSGKRIRILAGGYFARSLDAGRGVLQVGTEDEGVFELPLAGNSRSRGTDSAEPLAGTVERMRSLKSDVFALTSEGLFARRGPAWTRAVSYPGAILSDRNIAALAPDSSGRLWVGYFDRGLDIVGGALDRVTHREDEHVFCVNRIVPAPDKERVAVATANGLVMFDSTGAARQVLGREQGLIADHINDVAFSGNTLIAATPAGISFVGRNGIQSVFAFQGLVNNHVYTIAPDGNRLFAGTLGGLSMIEDGMVRTSYTTANSHLRHNWITALEKVDGEWFAGTYGAGVMRLDTAAEWHGFADLPRGLAVNPNALAVSATRVYAGCLGDGLYVYERAQRRWSRAVVGLPSLNVTAMAVTDGYLYAGTDNGLVRIREEMIR